MESLVADFVSSYDRLGMRASGKWADSLEIEPTPKGSKILAEDYTQYLTGGRPPNPNASEKEIRAWAVWAGKTFIKEWVAAKGLPHDPIAVAYKIAKSGTSWYPQGSDLVTSVLTSDRINLILNNVANKVNRDIELTFTSQYA